MADSTTLPATPVDVVSNQNKVPASFLEGTGAFFGTPYKPEIPEAQFENALTNLDLPGLKNYLQENPSTWQALGYGPKTVKGFTLDQTYTNPNDALARFVWEEIIEEPKGSYDFMFGVRGEMPMSPEAALSAMSQYRNVSLGQGISENAPRNLLASTIGVGVGTGLTVLGAPVLLAGTGAIIAAGGSDIGFQIFDPDSPLNQPYLPGSGGETGEYISAITAGSLPFLATPWAIPARTQVTLGTAAMAKNLERFNLFKNTKLPARLRDIEQNYLQTLSGAREAPKRFLTQEASNIGTATLAGVTVQETLPEEMGGFKTVVGFGAELLSPSFLRPVDYLFRGAENVYRRATGLFGLASQTFSEKQRQSDFMNVLIPAMLEAQNIKNPEQANQYIIDQIAKLTEAAEGPAPTTSGLASENAALQILEARLVGVNPEITAQYSQAAQYRNNLIKALTQAFDATQLKEVFDLRAEVILGSQEDVIWQSTVSALKRFSDTRQKLVQSGEAFDEGKMFQDFFFDPEKGLYADIRRQRRVLRGNVPRNQVIDEQPLVSLVEMYDGIREGRLKVGEQYGRLSFGNDLVSIDAALKSLKKKISPESVTQAELDSFNLEIAKAEETLARTDQELNKVREVAEADRTDTDKAALKRLILQRKNQENSLNTLFDVRKGMAGTAETESNQVTSGELLTLLDTLDTALQKTLKGGANPVHIDALDDLRTATLDALKQTGMGGLSPGQSTQATLALNDYLSFEKASSNVFSGTFLGDLRGGKFSYEKSASGLFEASRNTTAVRLQQLDEAVTLLNNFNLESAGRPGLAVEQTKLARTEALEGLPPEERAFVEGVQAAQDRGEDFEGATDQSSIMAMARLQGSEEATRFTPGQIQRLEDLANNPVDYQLNLRGIQRRLLRGFLSNPDFWERTPRLDRDGNPVTTKVKLTDDKGEPLIVDEPVYNYKPTPKFQAFVAENEKPLKEYFGSIYADILDMNKMSDEFNRIMLRNPVDELVSLDRGNAFYRAMLIKADENGIPEYRYPDALIASIVGTPGTDSTINRQDAPQNLRLVVRDMLDGAKDSKMLKEGLMQSIYNNAFVSAGGTSPSGEIDANAYFKYLFEPINNVSTGGETGRVPSIMNIMVDEGVITEVDRLNVRRAAEALKQIDLAKQGMQGRYPEIGNQTVEELTATGPMSQVVRKADSIAANFLTAIAGSAMGTSLYRIFTGGIGGPASIKAAASGNEALKRLLNDLPLVAQERMFIDMFQNPKVMSLAMEAYLSKPEKVNDLYKGKNLRTLYTWFTGAGLNMTENEFFEYFNETGPEVRREERREAGAAPMVPSRPNPRRVQPSIVPPPEPVTPPPQAAAFRPMPPPVAQAPAPTAQAPANPDQRARYAAMFPNDTASGLIRQGIGSLNG
jgi:hypothetical protein